MIQIRQSSLMVGGAASNDAADPTEATNPTSNSSPSEHAPARRPMPGADPLASFSAMYGLHADVQQFANAPRDRAEVGGHDAASLLPGKDATLDRRNGGDAVGHGDASRSRNVPVLYTKDTPPGGNTVGGGKTAPPPAFDVAQVTQAQIHALKQTPIPQAEIDKLKHQGISAKALEKLKNSSNPAKRQQAETIELDRQKAHNIEGQVRLAYTIENAKVAYGDLIANGARIIATTSAGNGGRPVLTIVGPGFKPGADAVIHTHYHGDNATVADPEGSKAGTNSRIRDTITKHPQTVFVLPEAANSTQQVDSPTHNNKYHADWTIVQSQVQTTADVLQAAGVKKPVQQIVSFHSGAGKVAQVLMGLDPTGGRLKADRLELYDSLYGAAKKFWVKGRDPFGWEKAIVDWATTNNGGAVGRVIYYHGNNEIERHNVIKDAFKDRFTKFEMDPKKQDDKTINPIIPDARGKQQIRVDRWTDDDGTKHVRRSVVHRFETNVHYQTTGQFLGSEPPPAPKRP